MKKIDVHCHTTNRKVRDVETQYPNIPAIETLMEKYEVEKTIVLATYFPHKKTGISNFRLYDWIRDNPKFAMFGSLDFQYYPRQGINELWELADRKIIKGIKIYTCYQEVDFNSDEYQEVKRIAKTHKLPMMFHTGLSYASMRKYDTPTVAKMFSAKDIIYHAGNNPGITYILSHMSKPFFEDIIWVCKNLGNVYTDMSGLIDSTYDKHEIPSSIETIKRFVDEVGPTSLLFGTDFPVQTHEHSIHFIEEAMKGYSDKDKYMVYYENADRLIFNK